MPETTLTFYSGLLSADPGTLAPLATFEQRHMGYGLTDDGSLPAAVVITGLRVRVCRGRFATHGESILIPPDYAIFLIPSGHTIPATNDASPPSDGGWVADWLHEVGSQAPLEAIGCDPGGSGDGYLYPVTSLNPGTTSLINPVTGLTYTRADLFAALYGVIFIDQNNNGFLSSTHSELRITEMGLIVEYDAGTPTIPPNDTTPCCGTEPGPDNPNPSSTPNPGKAPIPLQPWTPACAGGGDVPFASDVTDAESWTL